MLTIWDVHGMGNGREHCSTLHRSEGPIDIKNRTVDIEALIASDRGRCMTVGIARIWTKVLHSLSL
jgi:hypothetical protein